MTVGFAGAGVAMDEETSLYLDGARFLAAFVVLLCHTDEFFVPGLLPFVDHLGIEAVGIFFVLSGFVIGYATATRETRLRVYAVNRAARLWSVVIPCLSLTLVLDTIGKHYVHGLWYEPITFRHEAMHILLCMTFLNYSSLALPLGWAPGSNGPFWSLNYEVAYYALFAVLWFWRGARRVVAGLAVLAVFWYLPLYAALWFGGLGLYWLLQRIELSPGRGRMVLLASALVWAGFEALLKYFDLCPNVGADQAMGPLLLYGAGICFAISIVGFRFAGLSLRRLAAPLRWLAGATFTLYLLHFPLGYLLGGMLARSGLAAWPLAVRFCLVAGIVFAAALALAEVTERRKRLWRRGIERGLDAVEGLFGARAAGLEKG